MAPAGRGKAKEDKKPPHATLPRPVIKKFEIRGLHSDRDVSLSFRTGAKVIVADNGAGKTTLLNALYAMLSSNPVRLSFLEFEVIVLEFVDGTRLEFSKSELPDPTEWAFKAPELERFRGFFSEQDFRLMVLLHERSPSFEVFRDTLYRFPPLIRTPISPYEFATALRDSRRRVGRDSTRYSEQLAGKLKKVKEKFPFEIIFLPTYRRVEEDLVNLGLAGDAVSRDPKYERHIFFGMADVSERFEAITRFIIQSTAESYRSISARMLDQLIQEGVKTDAKSLTNLKRQDALELVLRRLGKQMTPTRRDQVGQLTRTGKSDGSDVEFLAYFLSNLIDIYDQQRSKDDQIKRFVEVANRYLVDKRLAYDEVKPHIDIYDQRGTRKIALERLSSGEKQLISMLSRLYLADQERYAIIVDEPELSLSIEWQRTLLPDLLQSNRCAFLLAATHSPFIFNNELDTVTSGFKVRFRAKR
jgi:predicted ATPase